jgi:hypothetical protein
MPQQTIKTPLPGTLFKVTMILDPVSNTGRISLERRGTEAEKVISDLKVDSIQSALLDLLEGKGLTPNPRIISRMLEDVTEVEAKAEAPISTDQDMPPVMLEAETKPKDHFMKLKNIIDKVDSHISNIDKFLIGFPDMPAEVKHTMKSLRTTLEEAHVVIDNLLSS